MKSTLRPLRLLLGGLFVFSGLVKLNDPVGTAIKLEEYFEVFAADFAPWFATLIPHALTLSLIFCVAEVVLGVAVLIRYRMKITMWLMLLLIFFFTFLTFYSAYFNKVTDCGCFGDFIKLTPWTSFGKDVVLLLITVFLFIRRKQMPNIVHPNTGDAVIALATAFFGFVGWYATVHLPYADWRPYRVGNNIPIRMRPSAAFKYEYTMEKDGKQEKFAEYPTDTTYTYVSMKVLNPEAAPDITDYRVWNDQADYTDSTFHGVKLLVIVQSDSVNDPISLAKLSSLINGLNGNGTPSITPWILTSLEGNRMEAFRHEAQLSAPFFYSDATVLKTIMRTKIGTWLLKEGRVLGKWSLKDTPSTEEVRRIVAEVS